MQIKIDKESRVKCPWCLGDYEANTWNEETYGECKSREMRRAFKPIFDIKVWGDHSDHFYKCPSCGMWSKGNQLMLLDINNNVIKSIGCKPIIRVNGRADD